MRCSLSARFSEKSKLRASVVCLLFGGWAELRGGEKHTPTLRERSEGVMSGSDSAWLFVTMIRTTVHTVRAFFNAARSRFPRIEATPEISPVLAHSRGEPELDLGWGPRDRDHRLPDGSADVARHARPSRTWRRGVSAGASPGPGKQAQRGARFYFEESEHFVHVACPRRQ